MSRIILPTATGHRDVRTEDGVAYARDVVDNNIANAVMNRNKELRRNQGAVKTTSFGKLELDIPLSHMPMLDKYFPGIADPGHPDHKWQLRKFMASPVSAPYRLQEQKRGVNRGSYIKS